MILTAAYPNYRMNTTASDLGQLLDVAARNYDPRADEELARHRLVAGVSVLAQQIVGQYTPGSQLNKLAERILVEVLQTWPTANREKVVFGERFTSSREQQQARSAYFLCLAWLSGRNQKDVCEATDLHKRVYCNRLAVGVGFALHDLEYRGKIVGIIERLANKKETWRVNT